MFVFFEDCVGLLVIMKILCRVWCDLEIDSGVLVEFVVIECLVC